MTTDFLWYSLDGNIRLRAIRVTLSGALRVTISGALRVTLRMVPLSDGYGTI